MKSRFPGRAFIFILALARRALTLGYRAKPHSPRSILIAHDLLLGDTLMLTPLLARLRASYPDAEILMTLPPKTLGLFHDNAYGVKVLAYSLYDISTLHTVVKSPKGFDLAILPGNNRFALLAMAAGARWIVAFKEDQPGWKNFACDELIPFPDKLTAVGDLFTLLATGKNIPAGDPVNPRPWIPLPPPVLTPPIKPPYAVLHVGAGNPLRYWPAAHWKELAERLKSEGIHPLFCGGPGEQALINAANPGEVFPSATGLDLLKVREILAGCAVLVCLDSGISHLAKLVGNPTITLYGPGAPELFGTGNHWQHLLFQAISADGISCRDQKSLFGRSRPWVNRCNRKPHQCSNENRCMTLISVEKVLSAALALIKESHRP